MKYILKKIGILLLVTSILVGCSDAEYLINISLGESIDNISLTEVPDYSGEPFVVINGNEPTFSEDDYSTKTFIDLSSLDWLGRTQEAYACLGIETMPEENEERGSIGAVKPSGWETKRYDKSLVDGGYIYNRCHCIAWSLSSLNAEPKNLMTGTRSFNVDGMLPFENMVSNYIRETNHHVLYKATPVYKGNELVARGLNLQAASVEDDEIRFNVYIYNVQDGIKINYETGKTQLATDNSVIEDNVSDSYIINISSHKIHKAECNALKNTKEENKRSTSMPLEILQIIGYESCKSCNPYEEG